MSGCSTQTGLTHHTPKLKADIPPIAAVRWIGDITAIALEWDPNHDPAISGYYIYRRLRADDKASYERIARINDRFTSHYIDLNLPIETKYLYTVSSFDHEGFESQPSKRVSTITRPTLKSVVYFDSLSKLPRKAKLIWRPHTNGRVSGYIVERKTPAEKEWEELGRLQHRLCAEYIDTRLDDNQVYLYRLRALTFDKILSTPSDIVRIVTKALPKKVTDITVTKTLPRTIAMNWAKHPQNDIKAFLIYRTDSPDGSFKLLTSVTTPGYIDKLEGFGKNYYYKVSAIDYDGLESMASDIHHGQNLTRPAKVSLYVKEIKHENVMLQWKKTDDRTVAYKVVKKESLGWFKENITPTQTNETTYITTQEPNVPVTYTIYALDKHGIESEPVQTEALIYEKVVQ